MLLLTSCKDSAINSPYTLENDSDVVAYSSFSLRPKHLDPARSYSANETIFTGQIYEPPLQYHFLKRPYQLEPLTSKTMPTITYIDDYGKEISDKHPEKVAYSLYQVEIKPGIYFQNHPAFSRDEQNDFLYHDLNDQQLENIHSLADFKIHQTRELTADDYIYQIKRLADPSVNSPILGLMSEYIIGLSDSAHKLRQSGQQYDLASLEIKGVEKLDRYRYQIKIKGIYPQFLYWLAMPFFAPVPWEADSFYQQAGLSDKNINLDWYPIGTGPFKLIENNPNSRMVLVKNENYHPDFYPIEGDKNEHQSLLTDAGMKLPFIDKVVFTLEKENTSYWNKFLQGYYDVSSVSSDTFEQAISVTEAGSLGLTEQMKRKGLNLKSTIETSIFYIGFNMLDPVVGGYSEENKKLRQAISIAIDYDEFISIFLNGSGVPAHGPIPPGIFGNTAAINQTIYSLENNSVVRRPISEAKLLLAEAGYPEGRSAISGEPLVINLDVPSSGPSAKSQFDWLRKQLKKIDIQLVIRNTDYNRFQDKMRKGQAQLFQWGWNADYPDPENFLFLLYGPNSKVKAHGENAANYKNKEFDDLFEQLRVMKNSEQRQEIIDQALAILTDDAPWVWGFHPKLISLYHSWNHNVKPNIMANNTLKYRRIDVSERDKLQQNWNSPILWPIGIIIVGLCVMILPAYIMYRRKMSKRIT